MRIGDAGTIMYIIVDGSLHKLRYYEKMYLWALKKWKIK